MADLKIRYPENHPPLTVLEAWQIHQKLRFKLSQDEDKDLERLKFILDRVTTENPDFPDGFNARVCCGQFGGPLHIRAVFKHGDIDHFHAEMLAQDKVSIVAGYRR